MDNYIRINIGNISNYNQKSFEWSKYNNPELRKISHFNEFIENNDLPEKLDRDIIVKSFRDKNYYKGCLLSMMWGGINATRPSEAGNPKTTNFYKALDIGKSNLNQITKDVEEKLLNDDLREAYKSLDVDSNKIPGIGESYFTKLLFFLGLANEIKPTPLIYDKWTKMIHVALLVDQNKEELLSKYYTKNSIDRLIQKKALMQARSGQKINAYIDYVIRMNGISVKYDLDVSNLEAYLFGKQLKGKTNKTFDNPRVWIHNYLKENLAE